MPRRGSVAAVLLVVALFIAALATAADFKYVGSRKSDKYHSPTCEWAKRISPSNLVTFSSAKDAQEAGYAPCAVCKPPMKD